MIASFESLNPPTHSFPSLIPPSSTAKPVRYSPWAGYIKCCAAGPASHSSSLLGPGFPHLLQHFQEEPPAPSFRLMQPAGQKFVSNIQMQASLGNWSVNISSAVHWTSWRWLKKQVQHVRQPNTASLMDPNKTEPYLVLTDVVSFLELANVHL